MLLEEKKIRNIVGTNREEILLKKHISPALQLAETIDCSYIRGVDIGSGSGLPGIVIAIAREELEILLLEPRSSRVNFIRKVKNDLDLDNVEVIQSRAEKIGHDKLYREKFDFVSCRAVAEISISMELALPFLKTGGTFYTGLSESTAPENGNIKLVADKLGGIIDDTGVYIKVKKVKASPDLYPREWKKIIKSANLS